MKTFIYPPQSVSVTPTPIQYLKNNVATTVAIDTATPANSNPLPVIAQALPLPSGAATAALQTTGNSSLSSIDSKLTSPLSTKISNGSVTAEVKPLSTQVLSTDNALVVNSVIHGLSTGGGGGYVDIKVNPSGALTTETTVVGTVPVSQSGTWNITNISGTVSLPTGAATNSELIAVRQGTDSLNNTLGTTSSTPATSDTGTFSVMSFIKRGMQNWTTLLAKIPTLTLSGSRLLVDGSGVTQPVSGSVSVSSLPSIPAGSNAIGSVSVSNFPAVQAVTQAASVASFQEILNLTTTAQTFTAPANATWCKIYADDSNTANIRIKIGGAATISSGLQLQPGRAEDFNAVGNISVIAESGSNQKINVHFGV